MLSPGLLLAPRRLAEVDETRGTISSRLRFAVPTLIAVAALVVVVFFAFQSSQFTSGGGEHLVSYDGDGFSFQYSNYWRVITGYQHYGLHGPTTIVVVGTGDFDSGCIVTSNSTTCTGERWSVPENGVVVAYYVLGWLGPIHPLPTPSLGPGDRWVTVGGRAAVMSRSKTTATWAFPGAPEYIQARFGHGFGGKMPSEIEDLIASWKWDPRSAPY